MTGRTTSHLNKAKRWMRLSRPGWREHGWAPCSSMSSTVSKKPGCRGVPATKTQKTGRAQDVLLYYLEKKNIWKCNKKKMLTFPSKEDNTDQSLVLLQLNVSFIDVCCCLTCNYNDTHSPPHYLTVQVHRHRN